MEWGFVMCYVGGHNVQQVEDRITSVEECLDGFLGESKDGDDGKGSGVSAELRKTDKRVEQAVRVAVEIHPPGMHEISRSIGGTDDS